MNRRRFLLSAAAALAAPKAVTGTPPPRRPASSLMAPIDPALAPGPLRPVLPQVLAARVPPAYVDVTRTQAARWEAEVERWVSNAFDVPPEVFPAGANHWDLGGGSRPQGDVGRDPRPPSRPPRSSRQSHGRTNVITDPDSHDPNHDRPACSYVVHVPGQTAGVYPAGSLTIAAAAAAANRGARIGVVTPGQVYLSDCGQPADGCPVCDHNRWLQTLTAPNPPTLTCPQQTLIAA